MNSILYFSPTGNVKLVAEKLQKQFPVSTTDMYPMEFKDPKTLNKVDHLIIMFSIHAFNPPITVKRFVQNIPEGLAKNVSIIAVGCADAWINRASTLWINRILSKKGYNILIEKVMAMPLTLIVPFPDEMVTELKQNADTIVKDLSSKIENSVEEHLDIPIKAKIVNILGKAEGPAARLFGGTELHADKSCTSCGLCVERCPEHNIKFNKKEIPKFGFNCLMCLRCIYECPTKSITPRFAKFIPIKGGYKIIDK